MKLVLLSASFLLASLSHAQMQVSTIHLRIVNGRNGHLVKRINTINTVVPIEPYATPIERRTDMQGSFSLLVQDDAQIRTLVTHYRTCRMVPKADRKQPPTAYPIQQILTSGVTGENHCSSRTIAPAPGTLTLFVRPLRWWQRLSY